jgi:hypothetical protein
MRLTILASLLALALAACGNNELPIIMLDAGGNMNRDAEPADMGTPLDLGVAPDAEPADTGEVDAGVRLPTFTNVYSVISNSCSCHTTGGTAPRLPNRATAYTALVDQPARGVCGGTDYVIPGDAMRSVIYRKLTGTVCGPREPRDAVPLSTADLEMFAAWINGGALDD